MTTAPSKHTAMKWAAVGLLVIILVLVVRAAPVEEWTNRFGGWIRAQGALGYLAFAGAYILGTVLFFPGSIMTIAAGIIFGPLRGTLIASLSATAGAAAAFLIARYLARAAVQRRAAGHKKFKAIDEAIGKRGAMVVLLLRLSPVIPFNILNYVLGLTQVAFWPYVWASWIGMLPGAMLYIFLGYAGKAALTTGRTGRTPIEILFLVVGLIATIALTVYLGRVARSKSNWQQ